MRKFCAAAVVALSLLLAVPSAAQQQQRRAPAPAPDSLPDIERRAESLLGRMTLEEKIDLIGGVDDFFIRGVERLGLPPLKMADGPAGVRNFGPATAMPGGIALAATWNPALVERIGMEIGRDARAKGVHFLLAPGVNIYRAPMNGRNFEYFGEDPYLAARTAVGYIRGVQSQGVSATVKHLLGNNSEFDRHRTDSVIDERTMREIYLPAFEAAVREARVGAVMNAYNLVNGVHMSQHGYLNTDVVKREWGFDGIMMSDWNATYDGLGAANGGLDLEMPSGAHMNRQTLLPAIAAGKLSVATIDDKVRRILRTAARFGWLDREQIDLSIPRYNPQGRRAALEAAREGTVLLKNEGALLPLVKGKTKSVAVIGPNAYPAVPLGGGSGRTEPFAAVSLLEGLSRHLEASAVPVYYARGLQTLPEMAAATRFTTAATGGQAGLRAEYFNNPELQGTPAVTRTEPHVNFGRQARSFPEQTLSSRWSGYYVAPAAGQYEVFASSTGEEGGFYRLYVDDKLVLDSWNAAHALAGLATLTLDAAPHKIVLEQRPNKRAARLGTRMQLGIAPHGRMVSEEAKKLAAQADVVVVAAGFEPGTESEGADRTFRLPAGQDELIRAMAAANKNTVVVLMSGGGVDMNAWLDAVPALVHAWYPGQEGGIALAEILLGEVNPSGRLPVTLERRWEDNPTYHSYYPEAGTNRVVYQEGLFVGYRGYERAGGRALFPFGHGLSYTTFRYGHLGISPVGERRGGDRAADPKFEVSFDVKNTGARAGAEVAQIYVGETRPKVIRPAKELKGFVKVFLRPGETKRVTAVLDGRAFAYYDVAAKRWRAEPGEFDVSVGRSSAQIELRGKLLLPARGLAASR
ncbi:MAG TPA: glycoside hydrolase family 3 C-terminal domain-containing protein [Pyrinomonadaceae bacterium]|jgi:beta-glucosidase